MAIYAIYVGFLGFFKSLKKALISWVRGGIGGGVVIILKFYEFSGDGPHPCVIWTPSMGPMDTAADPIQGPGLI